MHISSHRFHITVENRLRAATHFHVPPHIGLTGCAYGRTGCTFGRSSSTCCRAGSTYVRVMLPLSLYVRLHTLRIQSHRLHITSALRIRAATSVSMYSCASRRAAARSLRTAAHLFVLPHIVYARPRVSSYGRKCLHTAAHLFVLPPIVYVRPRISSYCRTVSTPSNGRVAICRAG